MISSLLHLVGLRPRVYYTLTNFRGGGQGPLGPPPLNTPMGHTPAPVHLKSRQPFLPNVQPMDFSAKTVRCANWRARLREKSHIDVGLPTEDLAKGHNSPWLTWRSLNRLRTGYTCSKEQRKKWKYYDGDTTCVCGLATENTAHLLQCSLLTRPCTLDDLLEFNDTGRECAERWKKTV